MFKNKLLSNNQGFNGIYRGRLLKKSEDDIRVFVPAIYNSGIKEEDLEGMIDCFPKIQWCAYNIESTDINNQDNGGNGPAFIMFENGDLQRPIVLSYVVIGGGGANGSSGYYDEYGNLITGGIYSGDGTFGLGDLESKARSIFDVLIANGASIGGAIAILGMLYEETKDFNTTAVNSGSGAYGLCQWLGDRLFILKNGGTLNGHVWTKPADYTDLKTQVEYLIFELKYNGHGYGSKISWNDVCKEYSSKEEVGNLYFNAVRYYEIPFIATSESNITGPEKENYFIAKNKMYSWYDSFSSGKIENGVYSNASNASVQKMLLAMQNIANAGYSYGRGPGQHDCSSSVSQALCDAGILPGNGKDYNTGTYLNMSSQQLQSYGFSIVNINSQNDLKPGDILIGKDHMAMYMGNGQMTYATSNNNRGIGIGNYYPFSYTRIIRYNG